MGLKKLSIGNTTFVKPSEMSVGQTIKGHYLGAGIDQFDKPSHKMQTSEGRIVINSAGKLDRLLEQVPAGAYVEITYQGTEKMTSGKYKGKDVHNFEVAVDEDSRISTAEADEEEAAPAPKKPSASLGKVK